MLQTIEPINKITIELQEYDQDDMIETDSRFVAWIKEPEYKGTIVQANTVQQCLKELGISLKILFEYKKNNK